EGEAVGVDISEENISFSRKKYPGVDYRVMDAGNLEFEDEYFDQAYCLDVMEHVDDLEKVITEIRRVLKPGGEFIVNVPYWKSEQWLQNIRPTYFKEIHHVRVFGEDTLEKLLADYRFSLVRKKRSGFLTHVFQYYMFKRRSSRDSQLEIGCWRENWKTKTVFLGMMFFDEMLFKTPLKLCPIWVITLPVGMLINSIGNILFPKSLYYIFRKNA
ncbi:MAG: class I SAM-dependent methyltransferase, partial [Candidatus Omnitrophota bacterium]